MTQLNIHEIGKINKEMTTMQNRKSESTNTQKAIQITLSNALDQSEKRLIEISPSQSIRDAVIGYGMAPSSQFDVFSSVGEVVTNKLASRVEGETLYVGPARIAGGRSGHRHHRQLGLVNQSGLESLKLHLTGDADLIVATLAQIEQMGACQINSGGNVTVGISPTQSIGNLNHVWQLPVPNPSSWNDIQNALGRYHGLSYEPGEGSLHLHFRTRNDWDNCPDADIHLTTWNGRAAMSNSPLQFSQKLNRESTIIDSPIEVASCSIILQEVLTRKGLIRLVPATDRWLTLSVRVDDVPPEVAVEMYSSSLGNVTASMLPDGTGSLLRIRIPLEQTSPDILQELDHPCLPFGTLMSEGWISVSPIPIKIEDGFVIDEGPELPCQLDSARIVVLGAGGLGSWAAPLFSQGVDNSGLEITLIDGDDSVDEHNLNRQVLYRSEDIGSPKAMQAASRIRTILGPDTNVRGIHSRLESNHVYEIEDIQGIETTSLATLFDEDFTSKEITEALDGMEVALACLDNMNSRTLLNRACIDRNTHFVNGGGEAFDGLVEILGPGVCMTCQYGEDAARSREQISCQEVGTRPVASIVTTTAWTGAMQAALALLVLCEDRGLCSGSWSRGLDFKAGIIQLRPIGRLPWFNDECKNHA